MLKVNHLSDIYIPNDWVLPYKQWSQACQIKAVTNVHVIIAFSRLTP